VRGVAARFAIIDEMGFIAGGEQRGSAADMFRRIYWDTALAASDPVLRMLRDVAGINQVLYGTDFPNLRRDLAVSSKQRILESSELDDSERHSRRQRVTPLSKESKCDLTSRYIRSARKTRLRQPLCDRLSRP
jgi:hypothetical protein